LPKRHGRRGYTSTRKYRYKWKKKGLTATEVVRISDDGRREERKDGTYYPKLTSIPVSRSVRELYGYLRECGGFHTYDALLIYLVKRERLSKEFRRSLYIDADRFRTIKGLIEKAEEDLKLRQYARSRANAKGRYFRRRS
jgi:hypothetical protein